MLRRAGGISCLLWQRGSGRVGRNRGKCKRAAAAAAAAAAAIASGDLFSFLFGGSGEPTKALPTQTNTTTTTIVSSALHFSPGGENGGMGGGRTRAPVPPSHPPPSQIFIYIFERNRAVGWHRRFAPLSPALSPLARIFSFLPGWRCAPSAAARQNRRPPEKYMGNRPSPPPPPPKKSWFPGGGRGAGRRISGCHPHASLESAVGGRRPLRPAPDGGAARAGLAPLDPFVVHRPGRARPAGGRELAGGCRSKTAPSLPRPTTTETPRPTPPAPFPFVWCADARGPHEQGHQRGVVGRRPHAGLGLWRQHRAAVGCSLGRGAAGARALCLRRGFCRPP